MFLNLQLSNKFIRTRYETMKMFTAQGAWWQTVLWWEPSSLSLPSWPERLLTSEALSKGIFIQRMNAGESCSETLSQWSISWDHFSHFCVEFSVEFQEDFSLETCSLIRIGHFIHEHLELRGFFLFALTLTSNFFCFKFLFRKLRDSSENQFRTGQTKSCGNSLLSLKHQYKWWHFQKVPNTVGFSSMSLTFATFCSWVVFYLFLLDISILALQK